MLESEDFVQATVFLPTVIDLDTFKAWIQGLSETEVAHQIQLNLPKYQLEADIRSNFTEFLLLEPELYAPDVFLSSKFGSPFQIDASTKLTLIQMYYDLDLLVLRELLGRKLNRKSRKDLEDISESTGFLIGSCQRQFENIRRVIKYCEDLTIDAGASTKLSDAITFKFHLNNELTHKYATAVFVNHHRFETNKRKQSLISFNDYQKCLDDIMVNWTYQKSSPIFDMDSYHPADLDYQFLQDLRGEIKSLQERKDYVDDLKQKTCSKLNDLFGGVISDIDFVFRHVFKAVLHIGSNLTHSKAVKELFVDIIDKIIEPCKSSGLSYKDMDNFQEAFSQSLLEYKIIKRQNILRFLQTLLNCVLILYSRINNSSDS